MQFRLHYTSCVVNWKVLRSRQGDPSCSIHTRTGSFLCTGRVWSWSRLESLSAFSFRLTRHLFFSMTCKVDTLHVHILRGLPVPHPSDREIKLRTRRPTSGGSEFVRLLAGDKTVCPLHASQASQKVSGRLRVTIPCCDYWSRLALIDEA